MSRLGRKPQDKKTGDALNTAQKLIDELKRKLDLLEARVTVLEP